GYRVSLQGNFFGNNHTYITFAEYNPREHIKLDPPLNIQSNITASKCQIQWTVPQYLAEILQYQLQYKEQSMSWEIALNKTPPSSLPQIEIEGTEFRSGISYIARVRCKVSENEGSYQSQWSDWSQTTVFQRAGIPELSEKLFNSRTLQFLFIPLSFGTLLYLFWNRKFSSRIHNNLILNCCFLTSGQKASPALTFPHQLLSFSHSIICTMGILR
ncbi:IL9R protein, partial [Penelope pileata]|nr:IL9R protein [Penelope pileata]